MVDLHNQIIKRINKLTFNQRILDFRNNMFDYYIKRREAVNKRYPALELGKEVRHIKEKAIPQIKTLTNLAMERMEENDVHVTYAKTATEARKITLEAIDDESVIVQGTSDLPSEIDLDISLAGQDQKLIATGTYHRLFQLSGNEVGFHKGYSTRYFTIDDWYRIIRTQLAPSVEKNPEALAEVLTQDIKNGFKHSNVSVSGVNAISAVDGACILSFSLGNLLLVSLRDRHIILAGIEKVVPSYLDAWKAAYLEALYSDGSGGAINQLMIRGPSLPTEVAGIKTKSRLTTKELHVVFIDNGRTQAIKEGFEEVLYCIRCYACHNHCPAYRILGPGIANDFRVPGFGYKGYIGGRGVVLSNFLFGLQTSVEAGLFTCTLCGACKQECPLSIDIPAMINRLRNKCLHS